jgi:hypothetical protein
MPDSKQNDHWTLDRKVPVAIILAIGVQFLGGLWFMSKLDSRVEDQDRRLVKAEAQIGTMDRDAREANGRLIRVEEKMSSMLAILQRVERALEADRPGK